MKAIDIWVEGVADQKFLADVLKAWYKLSFDSKFVCRDEDSGILIQIWKGDGVSTFNTFDGWQKIRPSFEENQAKGTKNLIVVDADENFELRKREVASSIIGVGFDSNVDLFLWPDQQGKGDLESLLAQIINPSNIDIFECWDSYETCLRSKTGKNYTIPAQKTKIYGYLEALLGETKGEKKKIKEQERDYTNADHWVLDEKSEPLVNLKTFLDKHFIADSSE